MLLAAGLGTRLRPYSLFRPKPLFPVLNRPLLHILIDTLRQAGSTKIIVNGHHLGHLVQDAVRDMADVRFQDEPEILGTGGSIRQALDGFEEKPVLVMNGDIFHTVDVAGLYNHHVASGNLVTMALHDYPRFNAVGVNRDRIISFQPAGDTAENSLLAFTGIHVVEPEVIRQIPAGRFYHIIDLYERLAGQGKQVGYVRVDDSYWRDIGTPEDYLQLHKELLAERDRQEGLSAKDKQWLIDSRAQIADDVQFTGWGCVGKGDIGHGAALKNCVVWDDAIVPAGACLKNSIITGQSH